MKRRLLAVATVLAVLLPAPAAHGETGRELFRFDDPAIIESSALLDLGDVMVTVNDSGNPSNLFVIDPRSGKTVGVTYLDAPSVDIEALAPAGGSQVWVGDLGDNDRERDYVSVYRAPVATHRLDVRPTTYDLVYPDGPHDAESLFSDRSGRLHVVTKAFGGSTVYRAPARLDPRSGNRLERVADVSEFATDAAVLPGGNQVIVRSYAEAAVYTLPGFRRLGEFDLPLQEQGEGISVGPDGRISLSSEGQFSAVVRITLPPELRAAIAGAKPTPGKTPAPETGSSQESAPASAPDDTSARNSLGWLQWSIPLAIVLGAIGIGVALRRKRS